MSEYNDTLKRSQRLSVARETLMQTNSCAQALTAIQNDDMEIYMRWLVCHFYSQKSFTASMKQLEWLPYQISVELLALTNPNNSNINLTSSTMNLGNQSSMMNMQQQQSQATWAVSPASASNYKFNKPTNNSNPNKANPYSILNMMMGKFKMLDNVYLATTNAAVPREDVFNSLSFRN
jgi:hypothetical protein